MFALIGAVVLMLLAWSNERMTSRLLAEEHLARGELVHVLPEWIFSRYTIYAALPSGRMLPARTKVFLDFLTRQVPRAMAQKRGQPDGS